MRKVVVVLIALVACSKSKTDDKAKPAEGPEKISNHELASAPLKTVTSTAGGQPFAIDLPVGELKPAEVKNQYASWEPKKAWLDTPSFSVTYNDMPMPPDWMGDTEPIGDDAKDRVIARAEKL